MDSEEYLEELHKKLNVSKYILLHYISLVGANEENIIDYALNADCAVVRKDKGFEISYTAKIINDKDQRIAELEQELAESEKRFVVANNLRKKSDEVLLNYKTEKYGLDKTIQELRKIKLSMPEKEWYYKGFENCERQISSHIADLTLENKQLKQQLAEKEKEIAYMTKQAKKFNNEAQKYYEDAYCNSFQNQKAIAELEKVKAGLKDKTTMMSNEEHEYLQRVVSWQNICDYINNKIKELKGE